MRKDKLPGGYADKKDYSKFDQEQRYMGQKVEMEHTDDPETADEITGDHLVEIPDYYTRLDKMEKEVELESEDDVLLAINSNEEVSILIKTPSGNYENHKFADDKMVNKPVKVSNYDRNTGHVQKHYRSKRMK